MAEFPLLKLPFLVLLKVIYQAEVMEIITFSQTSKKLKYFVQMVTRHQKSHLAIVTVHKTTGNFLRIENGRSFKKLPIWLNPTTVINRAGVHCKGFCNGLIDALDYLKCIFHLKTVSVQVSRYKQTEMKWLLSQLGLKLVKVVLDDVSMPKFYLNQEISELTMRLFPIELANYEFQPKNMKYLKIEKSDGVMLHHLRSFLNIERVNLSNVLIEAYYLPGILKIWTVTQTKVQVFEMKCRIAVGVSLAVAVEELDVVNAVEVEENDGIARVLESCRIRRFDGVTATVTYNHAPMEFTLRIDV